MNYQSCTLAELRDVAAHIDRERFPERAAEVDDEIKRRAALPIEDQEPVTFGGTLHRGLLYKAVGADLSFSTTELSFEINPIWGVSSFRIGRGDVERVVARTSFFKSGFEFVHCRTDLPRVIRFEPEFWTTFTVALTARRWPVG
jgi:hypothetical protein